jgi:hypothetical protein
MTRCADSGTAETREAAMTAFKAQWIERRGCEHPCAGDEEEVIHSAYMMPMRLWSV